MSSFGRQGEESPDTIRVRRERVLQGRRVEAQLAVRPHRDAGVSQRAARGSGDAAREHLQQVTLRRSQRKVGEERAALAGLLIETELLVEEIHRVVVLVHQLLDLRRDLLRVRGYRHRDRCVG